MLSRSRTKNLVCQHAASQSKRPVQEKHRPPPQKIHDRPANRQADGRPAGGDSVKPAERTGAGIRRKRNHDHGHPSRRHHRAAQPSHDAKADETKRIPSQPAGENPSDENRAASKINAPMSVEIAELAGDSGTDGLRQKRPRQSPAQQRHRSIHVFGDHAQRSPDDRERGTVRQQPQQHDSQQSPCVADRFIGG